MSEWQPIPKNKWQSVYRPKREIPVSNGEEAKWLKEVFQVINKGNNRCSKLDLLEVYAYPESNLTTVAQQSAGETNTKALQAWANEATHKCV